MEVRGDAGIARSPLVYRESGVGMGPLADDGPASLWKGGDCVKVLGDAGVWEYGAGPLEDDGESRSME